MIFLWPVTDPGGKEGPCSRNSSINIKLLVILRLHERQILNLLFDYSWRELSKYHTHSILDLKQSHPDLIFCLLHIFSLLVMHYLSHGRYHFKSSAISFHKSNITKLLVLPNKLGKSKLLETLFNIHFTVPSRIPMVGFIW